MSGWFGSDTIEQPLVTGWWAEISARVAPAPAVLTVVGGTPNVAVSLKPAPSPAVLTLTGGQPTITVTQHRIVTPNGALIEIIGSRPAVGLTLRPAAPTLTIAGGQPVIRLSDHKSIQPAPAALTITGGQPDIARTEHWLITPLPAPLIITGGQPFLGVPEIATPVAAALTIVGGRPVIGLTVAPTGAALSIVGGQPVVSTPVVVTPAPAALTIVGSRPAVGTTVRPAAAALTVTGGQPDIGISDHKTVTPTAAPLTVTEGQPTVTTTDYKRATPTGASLTITGGQPTVTASNHKIVQPLAPTLTITGGTPTVTVASSGPQLISSASAQATTVTMPTHAAGDLLIMFAERESNSGPGVPAGWGTIQSQVGANNISAVLAYKYAASSSETSGTWSNANGLIVEVWRNAKVGSSVAQTGSADGVVYPALSMLNAAGSSRVAAYGAHRNTAGDMGVAPAGMVNTVNVAGSGQDFASHATAAGVASWSSQTATTGEGASGYSSFVVELLPSAWKGIIGANTSVAATVAIPPHAPGDLIILWATSGGGMPTKPAASGQVPAYADVDTGTGSFIDGRNARFVATAVHTSGTWTNASGMLAVVITGQDATPIGGHAISGVTGSGGTMTAPSITLARTDGTSLILHMYGGGDGAYTNYFSNIPAGYTAQTPLGVFGTEYGALLITKNVTTSDGAASVTGGRSDGRELAATIEVRMS